MSPDIPQLRPLSTNSRQGLPEWVYDSLIDLLLEGSLKPGQPLRIDAVAEQLGVSATPVREALVRLQATGLVSRATHKGFRVAPEPDGAELVQLIEARLYFEPTAARVACEAGDPGLTEQMRAAYRSQEEAGSNESFEEFRQFLRGDQMFHQAIINGTGNNFVAMAAEAINGHVQRFRAFHGRVITDRTETLDEHLKILQAFENGDPEAAEAAMRNHLIQVRERVSVTHS